MRLLWKCDFEESGLKVSYSYSFGFDRQKMKKFWWENVRKSIRNYMEVIVDGTLNASETIRVLVCI